MAATRPRGPAGPRWALEGVEKVQKLLQPPGPPGGALSVLQSQETPDSPRRPPTPPTTAIKVLPRLRGSGASAPGGSLGPPRPLPHSRSFCARPSAPGIPVLSPNGLACPKPPFWAPGAAPRADPHGHSPDPQFPPQNPPGVGLPLLLPPLDFPQCSALKSADFTPNPPFLAPFVWWHHVLAPKSPVFTPKPLLGPIPCSPPVT